MKKKNRRHGKRNKIYDDKILTGTGIECPRCKRLTARWTWADINARLEATKSFAYTHWFECMNRKCKTRTILPGDPAAVRHFKTRSTSDAQQEQKSDSIQDEIELMNSHFRSI